MYQKGQAVERGQSDKARHPDLSRGPRTPARTGSNTEHDNEDDIESIVGIPGEIWQRKINQETRTPFEFKDREGGRSTRRPTELR